MRYVQADTRLRVAGWGASLLVVVSVVLIGLSGASTAPAAPPASFAAGSLIIPMDTDTSGNHTAFNQNSGMWKSYGLVYKLLQNGIPVHWAILETKSLTTNIDFTVTTVKDKRTGTGLSSWDYRGGPFLIDSANAAAALPIITAWWAANGNLPNVHEALASFSADVNIILRSPPRIANESINAGISIGYFNTAGIPDLNGNPWSTSSPNILDEAEIAAGGLFAQGSVCLQRKYDVFVTPHNSGYAYSLSDPTNLGTKTYSQLDTFVHQGGGWTALCHSVLSNENFIRDLTVNGSAAVKALFKTSLPGGQPGGFLTSSGFTSIDNTGGLWTVDSLAAKLPVAQVVPTAVAQALPGGSVQTWPSTGNPGAPAYYPETERVGYFEAGAIDHDNIIAGTYHNGTGLGKLTYIGGHSFSTAVPYSGNFEAPYLRAFYNSLFFNGSAVAKLDLTFSPTTFPQNGTGLLTAKIVNTGASTATNVANARVTLAPGFTYVATTSGPPAVVTGVPLTGETLTWSSLGPVAGGATPVTFTVSVGASISGTAGAKQFGQFHAEYGDVFGEGFTADVCRDLTVSPTPAPSLTKTPSSQGPVSAGSSVTWTLTYGNTGAEQLLNTVLQDTLPPGFTYVTSSSTPSLGAATVIPAPSGTIVRWNVGTITANTPTAGTVTLTARAGAVTSGTGDPLQQTFTNRGTLKGKDVGGNEYSADASATVVVQALDLTLGKSVNKTFLTTLPDTVTYTLTPGSSSGDLLENVRVIDPYPAGLTAPPVSVGQGGSFGAYVPIAAVPGTDPGPPVLDTAITVGSNFVIQGGSVSVTLNVKSSTAISTVSPTDLAVSGGTATCTGPIPASANVPAGGAGVNFAWSCTLNDLGEYIFGAGADDVGATTSWPDASSASVLSAPGGGPSVVAWNLGSNTDGVPGETLTSGYTAGVYGFRGATQKTFQKYGSSSNAWTAMADATDTIAKGGALTTDGAGTIYGLRGNNTQTFYAYDVATNAWSGKANTGANVNEGGALVFLNVSGTNYVFGLIGNSTGFRRYNVGTNTWAAMATTPDSVKAGGALTTDGTYIYALGGNAGKNKKRFFYRYDPGANTWATRANTPGDIGWGGALTRVGSFIYALEGNNKNVFYRYDIGANSWSSMAVTPGAVQDGGALTTDGTYVYAFQGKTAVFWRYDITANTWTALSSFTAATNQGGALVFVPGVNPQGRFSSLTADHPLVVTGDATKVTFRLESSAAVNNLAAGALTVTPTGAASCSSLTGPTLVSADDDIANIGDPVDYEWICTAAAGANPGSLKFSASASGAGPTVFPAATSNSVLVSPSLTFQATVPIGAPNPVVNMALMVAGGQTTSSPLVTTNSGAPVLTIVKTNAPTLSTMLRPGDSITYTMVVQNTGTGNATNVVVTDAVPGNTNYVNCSGGTSPCSQSAGTVSWTVATLAPGATATVSFTVSASTTLPVSPAPYTITNSAGVTSTQTPAPVVSNIVTNELQVLPTIIKSVSLTEAAPGDTLTYTLGVSNPGAAFTADVTDVVPAGTSFAGLGTCTPACTLGGSTVLWSGVTIAPGTNTFTFDATVTASGGATVTNSGSLDPTSPDLDPIPSNPVETEIGPSLEIVKLNSPTGQVVFGNTITYTLLVSNESTVTATGVVVSDPVPVGTSYVVSSCTTPTGTCGLSAGVVTWSLPTLAGSGSALLSFQVTIGTPPAGTFQIANQAQVAATNSPAPVFSNSVFNPLPVPAFVLTKTAGPTTYSAVGNVISYSYVVTNNSTTVTVAGPVTVTDDKATVTCPAGGLTPLASMTCTAGYVITQADLDAGSVTNMAQAHANGSDSNAAEATVTAVQSPALSIVKTALPLTYSAVGAVIGYSFKVTNSGNTTLVGPFTVSDDRATDEICPLTATLAPGAFITCTASYTVTQADLDAGSVTNVASATNGVVTSPTDTATATATQSPALTIVKSIAAGDPYAAVGDVISYSFLVTNAGNVALPGLFEVNDDKASDESCPVTASLAPAETVTCTASYTVTQADLDAGSVTNVAFATNGVVASPTDTATATATLSPGPIADIAVTKTSAPNPYVAGGTLTYTVTVTNNGPSAVVGAAFTDTVPAALTGVTWTCAITTGTGACSNGAGNGIATTLDLASGAVVTLTIVGTVDSGTTGTLSNTATATTPSGTLDPIPGNNAATDANPTSPAQADPAIAISPAATSVGVGSPVPFTVTVTNNGPAAADGVKALISVPPGFGFVSATGGGWTCSLSVNLVICDLTGQLASGGSAVITLNLTAPNAAGGATINASVTSTTADTNSANNTAAATVTVTAPPAPAPTPAPTPAPAPAPAPAPVPPAPPTPPTPAPPVPPRADLSLTKKASPARATTGDRITYTLTATNNGPDAARSVVITDTLPTTITFVSAAGNGWDCRVAANIVSCSRPTLASGASSTVRIVGTANHGGDAIVNAASISSATADPSAANNTATATIDVAGRADLAITKTASSATYVPGRVLSYTINVTNRGPDDVTGARVRDIVPAQLEGFSWTCSAVSGRCGSFSGRGAIDQLIDIRKGGSVVFTLVGTVGTAAPSELDNGATVAPPAGTVDPNSANNRDRITVRLGIVPTRLKVSITPPTATLISGVPIPATIFTTNVGKSTARNVLTCLSLPSGITVAKAAGGFPLQGRYCWRTRTVVRGAHVTFRFQVRGDARLVGKVRLVAGAEASNAPAVVDTSRVIVLPARKTHQGGYTG